MNPGGAPVNATAAALLGLLRGGPMAGGQLVAEAGERFGGFFSVTRSQVYRELPILVDAGLLRLGRQGPRSSQTYAITPAGKRAFKAWLLAGSADQLRSPLVLRLLHADTVTPRQRAKLVADGREVYGQRLSRARAEAKAAVADGDPYQKAVADFTVAHLRAMLKLLDAIPVQ